MNWDEFQREQGANLAPDGIPLDYGDLAAEYHAALEQAILMDRSHEGRLESRGKSRFDLIQRISTNDVLNMPLGTGQPTIFTNANGRIIDRIMVYSQDETGLITTEPGRGEAVRNYLQRQVFFNDDFHLQDLSAKSRMFTLHGPKANPIIEALTNNQITAETTEGSYRIFPIPLTPEITAIVTERKGVSGSQWAIIAPNDGAELLWNRLMEVGKTFGLIPAGSLTYNALRIRAGRPTAGRELSTDYIPLEAGLWDEVSFSKGCYTGQEIIARMESRNRLAKTLVKLHLSQMVNAPATLYHDGKAVGTLTSSVTTPDGEILGIGFVKTALAEIGQPLTVGEAGIEISISELAGVQPPTLATNP